MASLRRKCWGEFMHLIKILFPALQAASCSCTSKWFSHKKLWEEASLYNTDSDTGKWHDLRKHSLVHQQVCNDNCTSKYSMDYCKSGILLLKNPKPEKFTSPWASLSSVWEHFSCRSASEQLHTQKVQAIRNWKPPAAHKTCHRNPDIWFWRKQICISRQS